MIKISQKDFESLKTNQMCGGLHGHIIARSRNGRADVISSPTENALYIKEESLGIAFQRMLAEWIKDNAIEVVKVPDQSAPVAAPKEDGLARLQREQREAAAETAKLIEDTANKRAAWYISHEGMLDNDFNRDLFLGWFDRNKAAYTAANVDLAVAGLPELQFAVWAPRLQPVDATPLIEGTQEKQLPLDASESMMRKASLVQLRDLSRRKKEGQGHRQGSFGSSFIEPTF